MELGCPICGAEVLRALIRLRDGSRWGQCTNCGLWIHEGGDPPEGDVVGGKDPSIRDLAAARAQWQLHLFRALARQRTIRSVFDIGCGPGIFLHQLRRLGVQADGIELDPELAEEAEVPAGDFLEYSPPADAPALHYDLVTAFDVIEHLDDLRGACTKAAELGNLLLITTPDGSFLRAFLHSPEHRVLFTISSLYRWLFIAFDWARVWRYTTDPRRDPTVAKYGDSALLVGLAGKGKPFYVDFPGYLGPFRRREIFLVKEVSSTYANGN